ncbi:hypothetical protein ABZN20_13945 [Methylococcus sp. ANG]|uniref:hypothetical protein n=1 Tax=Methylococcus sp. ANG TaxID=3231903 RepID=UPI0034597F65
MQAEVVGSAAPGPVWLGVPFGQSDRFLLAPLEKLASAMTFPLRKGYVLVSS